MNRGHAIVIGASIAGLGTARILSQYFERVTVLDRDALPTTVQYPSRDAILQGNHAHGLLASGYRVLDAYFPGIVDELVAEGALLGDYCKDFAGYFFGNWTQLIPARIPCLTSSRPCLEAKIRQRVKALPNVTMLEKRNVLHPIFDSASRTVKGVKLVDIEKEETLTMDADLVVDASGRVTQSPKWLESWGYKKAPETSLKVDVTYSTFRFERKPTDFKGHPLGVAILGVPPASKRGGYAIAIEGNNWSVSLTGKLGDHPSINTIEAFREYARSLPASAIYDLIKDREPITEFAEFSFPGYRRGHYEKLEDFPKHYLLIGDALCNLNPTFAQGMSTALKEAAALDECLAKGDENLAKRFFAKASAIIDVPWSIVTGEDLRYPEVEDERPSGWLAKLREKYMDRLFLVSFKDPVVFKRTSEVMTLLTHPSAFFAPNIVWRVLIGSRSSGKK